MKKVLLILSIKFTRYLQEETVKFLKKQIVMWIKAKGPLPWHKKNV
jgi:hypothetical protein